jgi:hypothetical protein
MNFKALTLAALAATTSFIAAPAEAGLMKRCKDVYTTAAPNAQCYDNGSLTRVSTYTIGVNAKAEQEAAVARNAATVARLEQTPNPFTETTQGFQNYLNNTVNWDNNTSVTFSGLGNCSFSTYGASCYSNGYVTVKNPVENKTCYVNFVSYNKNSNRTNYTTGQCSYNLF